MGSTEAIPAALESERSRFKSQLFHLPAAWPWVGPLISLCINRASVLMLFWWSDETRYASCEHSDVSNLWQQPGSRDVSTPPNPYTG